MSADGSSLNSFSIPNDLIGADNLLNKILSLVTRKAFSVVKVSMEATSNLGWHLAHYLKQQLLERVNIDYKVIDYKVYVLNARKVARFKKGYDNLPKTDRLDAWVIADHLRFGRLPHEMTDCIQFEALQRLTRTRFHLMQNISRDKTYFLNQMFLKFSGLRQDNPFSSTFGATCLSVLQELEPEEIAQYLQKLARASYRLDKAMADPVNLSLSVMLSVIQAMEREVKKLDKEIEKIMAALPQTLTSVKGIGKVYAAGIIAEIGDIKRFKHHSSLAKYAGLVWNQYQSGEFTSEETKRMATGNKYLRYYLVQAADHIRRYDSEYSAFYKIKYDQVSKHKHKRALVLTARKLIRLVFMLLKTNKLYLPPERRG